MKPTGKCKSCRAPIVWAVSGGKGNRMPLDPEPVPDGNVWIVQHPEGGSPVIGVALHHDDIPEGTITFVSHFVSCKFAAEHRKKKR